MISRKEAEVILAPLADDLDRIIRESHARYYDEIGPQAREDMGPRSRASAISDFIWTRVKQELVEWRTVRIFEQNGHRVLVVQCEAGKVNVVLHKLSPDRTATYNDTRLARCANNQDSYTALLPFTDTRPDVLEQLSMQHPDPAEQTVCIGYTEADGALVDTHASCQEGPTLLWAVPLSALRPLAPTSRPIPIAPSGLKLNIKGMPQKRAKHNRKDSGA